MIPFDIETGALPEDEVLAKSEPFDADKAVPPVGLFDPDSVKFGNTKDADKRKAMVEAAREEHEAKRANRGDLIEIARHNYVKKLMGDAALHAHTGQVLAIGMAMTDGQVVIWDSPEQKLLRDFWEMYEGSHYDHKFVGHNIHGFDLPFMVKRSWYLGIRLPFDLYDERGYFHRSLVDLMKIWGLGERGYIKLDRIAELFGVGRKTQGITGADFARLWNGTPEERQQAVDYLESDIALTAAVAKRMGIE